MSEQAGDLNDFMRHKHVAEAHHLTYTMNPTHDYLTISPNHHTVK